jgi:hypothetical protein
VQGVDQVAVKEIASTCTDLTSLNISNLENIGRVAFQSFHFLSNLQILDVSNNRNIDHNDMEVIGLLTKIVTLLLKNCTRVRFLQSNRSFALLEFHHKMHLKHTAGRRRLPCSLERHVKFGAHRHQQLSSYQCTA